VFQFTKKIGDAYITLVNIQDLRALLEDYADAKNREQIELLKQQIEDMKSNQIKIYFFKL
jgi:hypothetical protein